MAEQSEQQTHEASSVTTLVAAGVAAAFVIAMLTCQLPRHPSLTWLTLFLRATMYVAVVVAAGATGMKLLWVFLSEKPYVQFGRLVRHALVGWAFLPVVVLLYREEQPWIVLAVGVATAGTALGARRLFPDEEEVEGEENFVDTRDAFENLQGLQLGESRLRGAVFLALCAQASVALAANKFLFLASLFVALSVFLLCWQWSALSSREREGKKFPWWTAVFAPFVTAFLLTPWLAHPLLSVAAMGDAMRAPQLTKQSVRADFLSVILWPPVQKKKEIASPRVHASLAPGFKHFERPIQVPFDGPYWYFEEPDAEPGKRAFVKKGLPTDPGVHLHSAGGGRLTMQARQSLHEPLNVDDLSALDVALTNADVHQGTIDVGVWLTNSKDPEALMLVGVKTIASSQGEHKKLSGAPAHEVVRFDVPAAKNVKSFDRITVFFLPAWDHSRGVQVAVTGFTLLPK